jgi:DNA-binding response OmpR family regulator
LVKDAGAMIRQPRVLVVDDEAAIVTLLRDFLEGEGFGVLTAPDGAAALSVLGREGAECVVLDIMMPGPSGFDVCRQIRAATDVPILFLTARDDASDKIRGFRLGADDFVVKATATPEEVVERVKALLRRAGRSGPASRPSAADEDTLDFGRLVIDVRAHEVRLDGVPVPMPAREFALLHLLAAHPRQAFSREQLFSQLWGAYGDESTVTTHIRRLREKIEEDPTDPRYIVTVWGVGYRFDGHRRCTG